MKKIIGEPSGPIQKSIFAIIILTAVVLALVPTRVQQERIQALSMQAMLVNIAIAEEKYQHQYGQFTQQWQEIEKEVVQPDSLQVQIRPQADQPGVVWMSFAQQDASSKNGYWVRVQPSVDGQSVALSAQRVGSRLFEYVLTKAVPANQDNCTAKWTARWFCKRFLRETKQMELANLIPVQRNIKTETLDEKNEK